MRRFDSYATKPLLPGDRDTRERRNMWHSQLIMLLDPAFPVRHYFHGDLSEDQTGRAFCARCGGFHPPEHFGDLFHALIRSAKLAQSVGSWMHNVAHPNSKSRRPDNAGNLFDSELPSIAKSLQPPAWGR